LQPLFTKGIPEAIAQFINELRLSDNYSAHSPDAFDQV
jgi:hypothetical protein